MDYSFLNLESGNDLLSYDPYYSENITDVEVNINEFQEVEKMTVILTKDGFLKTFKEHLDDVKINNNIKNVVSYKKILSNQKLLLFVSSGRVYTIDPNFLPAGKSHPCPIHRPR